MRCALPVGMMLCSSLAACTFNLLSVWLRDGVGRHTCYVTFDDAVARERKGFDLDDRALPRSEKADIAVGQIGFDLQGSFGGYNAHDFAAGARPGRWR